MSSRFCACSRPKWPAPTTATLIIKLAPQFAVADLRPPVICLTLLHRLSRWRFHAISADKEEIIEERDATAKRRVAVFAALAMLAGITFFFGLGRLALIGPDEPRYAEVPREMVATGDYVSPRLGGCFWFEKPVLQYWMSAAAFHIFGVNEFAARAPSALAATLTALALFFTIRRAISRKLALAVAIVLLSMGIMIAYARIVSPDMPLAASISAAIICGFLAIAF